MLYQSSKITKSGYKKYESHKYSTYSSIDGGNFNWYCSKCDTEISESDKTCPKCGIELDKSGGIWTEESHIIRGRKYSMIDEGDIHWYCTECDAEVNESDKTCSKCGVEFE